MTDALFIADLHLDPARPRATAVFIDFLRHRARRTAHLYILGDLFEFWIGDDDDSALATEVRQALADYTSAGGRCSLMRGNRDFLLGQRFATATGTTLLADPSVVEVAGTRVLLMHGDLLCTHDHAYQRYRRRVHDPHLQKLFLALPRSLRRLAGAEGRRRSQRHTQEQPAMAMDVSDEAVVLAMREARSCWLIHGHTHKPAIHDFMLDDRPATRAVLGAWHEAGSVLSWTDGALRLESLPF